MSDHDRKNNEGIQSSYPIEIKFPDLAPYAAGNTGIPYVFSFDSGKPGPHVMVNALTHGNEVCGAIVVKELLDLKVRPRIGQLTLSFSNVDAYRRFNPAKPDSSRFVDQDFNRVWSNAVLDDTAQNSVELARARVMRPLVDSVDFLLDLHSMHERSEPLIVSGPLEKGVSFARDLGIPSTIICDEGHPEGRRLRDYADFGSPGSPKNALLIECGQHWEAGSVSIAQSSTARFLEITKTIHTGDLPEHWSARQRKTSRVVQVTYPIVASSMNFSFAGPYTGLETFAETGTVIAWDNGKPVTTPYPDCVLVMPSLRQLRPGVTVARLGKWL